MTPFNVSGPDDDLAPQGSDWLALGEQFIKAEAVLMHDEATDLCGAAFYAEVLRRVLGGHGRFVLLDSKLGAHTYMPKAEHEHALRVIGAQDRANTQRALDELRQAREQHGEQMENAARLFGQTIRHRADSVTGRHWREGVLLAASWLDPPETSATEAGEE